MPIKPLPTKQIPTTPESKRPWDAEPGVLKLVGERVRFVRDRAGKTAAEVAKIANLPRTHISDIERGKRNATIRTLDKIAKGIGCSLRDLMPPP